MPYRIIVQNPGRALTYSAGTEMAAVEQLIAFSNRGLRCEVYDEADGRSLTEADLEHRIDERKAER